MTPTQGLAGEMVERLREILAQEMDRNGEKNLAAMIRSGTDNSSGGTAALAAMTRIAWPLAQIAALDPEKDSKDGYNEWGEAECFGQAQEIARAALGETP